MENRKKTNICGGSADFKSVLLPFYCGAKNFHRVFDSVDKLIK